MITSEEVRKQLVEMLPRRFSNAPSNIRKFKAHDKVIKYVRQQEKVSELLRLYKLKDELKGDEEVVYDTLENGQKVINVKDDLLKRIEELESELND